MAEIRTVTTLRRKQEEIRASIVAYEQKLAQARADLSHVTAAIALFDVASQGAGVPPYADIHRMFARGEMMMLCKAAMAEQGPMTTRELARYIMADKGLDVGDKVLAKAVAHRLIHALRQQWKRGRLIGDRKRKNVRVWELPTPPSDVASSR